MDLTAKITSIINDLLMKSISEITDLEAEEIYALSFCFYNYEDDLRLPVLIFGYNTLTNFEASILKTSDKNEAKWNYAFWLQNQHRVVGEPGTESGSMIKYWIDSMGLSYSDEDEENNFEECMDLGGHINDHFLELAEELARQLHTSGIIEQKFKKQIPIIIHELEYYGEIAELTQRANPPGLADEFADWVNKR